MISTATIKSLFDRSLNLRGKTTTWNRDKDFLDAQRRVKIRNINGVSDECCFVLFRAAQGMSDLPGNMIEIGCEEAKSARFMAAGLGVESEKTFHAIDLFEDGLNNPLPITNKLHLSEDAFVLKMQMYEYMVLCHKGVVPSVFNKLDDASFCLAHINPGGYQATLDSLTFVYDRTVSGGMIICNNYGVKLQHNVREACDAFFTERKEVLLELPTGQALIAKA